MQREYDRYSAYWNWKATLTRAAQGGLCAYPGCDRPIWQVHHAVYQHLDDFGNLVPIRGCELEGIHIFGLCKCHHSKRHPQGAHHPRNWIRGRQPPDFLDARQETDFYLLLVQGFKEKAEIARDRAQNQNAEPIPKPKPVPKGRKPEQVKRSSR